MVGNVVIYWLWVVGVGEEKVVGWLAEGYGGVGRTGHTARLS